LSGIKLTKSFHAEELEMAKFEAINNDYTALNIKAIWYYSWFFPVLETLIAISIGLVVAGVSLFSFSDSHYSAGMISAFILYLNMLFRPMRFLADKFNQLQMGFVACERVFKLLETPSLEQDNGTEVLNHVEGKIEFQNVEFSYLPEQKILHGISFSIEAGKSLAIVGATGSGKTSIINILNRFYPIEKGQILLDDININKYTIASLRSHIGMVLQDVFLFSGSILDNIRLENHNFTKEDAMKLAAELEIDDFFNQLPQGFDYQIIERGNSLSHGQRQVISFFRAIVKNPSILVLDEATSSIDSNTEYYIQKLIPKIIKNKTSIIIAHRLSTIMSADKILVLNKGEIVGEGTHEELLASNAHYQKYFTELE
jgi:ATP-binding cassette subfamily B protein